MRCIWPRLPTGARGLTVAALAGSVGCGFQGSLTGVPIDARVDGPGPGGDDAAIDGPAIDGPAIDGPAIDGPAIDGPAIDAPPIDGGPAQVCYGPAGAWRVCLDAAPTEMVELPRMLNTDTSERCLEPLPAGWRTAQPDACFIVGATITVPPGTTVATEVTGTRPLVLVAARTITIAGLLDVAGHERDNNSKVVRSPAGDCVPFPQDPDEGPGGGGGAGGSFMTEAGNGGRGNPNSRNGQAAPATSGPPVRLHAGCPGQRGGGRALGDEGIGRAGGAVYLLAGEEIALSGTINASGAGGSGSERRTGGSGGGSGGMIVLHASKISAPLVPVLMANGGSGSAGGSSNSRGANGNDPSVAFPTAPTAANGNGGAGHPALGGTLDARGGVDSEGGGGGGGGAAGYIRANQRFGPVISSPPIAVVP